MQIYTVGGAVRDALLGLPVKDRDYVVVGATPEAMVALGYTPVGKDFPVFLHPKTHEEYALARTERKTAPGYRGFVFHAAGDVTLEQDLARRDLTINAIAQAGDGALVDPYGGRADLAAKLFRHVSAAFAEDPVRILRVARFAARFTGFSVAPETNLLMQTMVASGEVDALVPERVWQELARGLMEQQPSRMIDVLRDCGALARLLPELDAAGPLLPLLDQAAAQGLALPLRVAVLLHDPAGDPTSRSQRVDAIASLLKMPADCRDLAVMVTRDYHAVVDAPGLSAEAIVGLIERSDGLRKPQRFADMVT
ncbi:MAG: multifunctional CCA tRNA nucleotidyl transferase/2'3'-cyclic phosphodiesterase/2'nucleotidase/phosphatase, partial [Oxalobacteraceae bacterium]|nr:multifunctional CCA tRNA nucleotidyl transferase/2'3'-cyclic phosphodiesterase/2'nucleotidase/phosphatase [Oxalobacteraceae bacterium]